MTQYLTQHQEDEIGFMMHDALMQFYLGTGQDNRGRTLQEILTWSDLELEMTHDYIQWLFPLTESSFYNCNAPRLQADDIIKFCSNSYLQQQLLRSLRYILTFYGFQLSDSLEEGSGEPQISLANNFSKQARNWLNPYNHNYLRITRILKCLCLTGLSKCATVFLQCLETLYQEYTADIGEKTLWYWRDALTIQPPLG